jgi:hypothetical protein
MLVNLGSRFLGRITVSAHLHSIWPRMIVPDRNLCQTWTPAVEDQARGTSVSGRLIQTSGTDRLGGRRSSVECPLLGALDADEQTEKKLREAALSNRR